MGPEWTIYAAGDGDFLWWVLRGVAMITGDGSWDSMVAVGFFLGILWVILKGLIDGAREIEVQSIVSAWLLFSVLFGTTSSVLIEDTQSGALAKGGTPIEEVPLGVAAAGGIISTIGKTITDLFEQVYTMPGQADFMTVGDQGFGGTLETMMRLRGLESLAYQQDSTGFLESAKTYVAECVTHGMNIVNAPLERTEILNAENPLSAMRFDSDVYWTTSYIGEHVGMPSGCVQIDDKTYDCSCADAHDALLDFAATYKNSSDLNTLVSGAVAGRGQNPGNLGAENAIEALLSSTADHNQYIVNRVLKGAIQEGEMMAAASNGDMAAMSMLETARAQRDTAWALEDSMFRQVVVPLMTFLESAMYAVTPIVALMIVLGSSGFQMLVKYLGFVGWTQLWLPVLAIINFFAQWATSRAISNTIDAMGPDVSPVSLNGIGIIESELQHWLGVAGMLGAATPVITLMLITGSTMAATRLTGQFETSSGNVAQDQTSAPVDVSPGQVAHGSNGLKAGDHGWSEFYDQSADGRLGSLTLGASAAQQAQQMETAAAGWEQAYAQNVSSSVAEDQTFQQSWGSVSSASDVESSNLGVADQKAWSHAEALAEKNDWSAEETRAFAASLSGGASTPNVSPVDMAAKLEASSSENFKVSDSVQAELKNTTTESGTLSSEYSDVQSASEVDSQEDRGTASVVDSAKEEHSEQLRMAESYREQAEEAETWGENYGLNREMQMAEARTQIANDSGSAEKYRDWQSERLENLGREDEAAAVQEMSGTELADHFTQTALGGPEAGENPTQFYQGLAHSLDQQGAYGNPYQEDGGFEGAPTAPSLDAPGMTTGDGTSASDIEGKVDGPEADKGDGRSGQQGMQREVGSEPADRDVRHSEGEERELFLPAANTFGMEFAAFGPGGELNAQEQGAEKGQELNNETAQAADAAEMAREGAGGVYDVVDNAVEGVLEPHYGAGAPGIGDNPQTTSDTAANAITGTGNALTGGLYGEAVEAASEATSTISGWFGGGEPQQGGGDSGRN
ncbi:TraG-like protein, N-terminal region [Thiohalospira halophila DSM 15071]|uniref:TraG-like protein, N-terminal region n=1 Tax=Thiohalospira halophila DSM 15071 TaxID=1123397 RepID=A0A1I1MZD4_9GAMM|nr:conjugal transfer protein TraG N-terminal domain-containing protein [Thiohalospira halophila]SFC90456.1 TraG-like protein, N-terminal region [Thiohalospira halophila DSM 15071]